MRIGLIGAGSNFASIKAAMPPNRRQPKSCVYDALRWGYTQVTSQALKPPLSAPLLGSLQSSLDGLFRPAPVRAAFVFPHLKTDRDGD